MSNEQEYSTEDITNIINGNIAGDADDIFAARKALLRYAIKIENDEIARALLFTWLV